MPKKRKMSAPVAASLIFGAFVAVSFVRKTVSVAPVREQLNIKNGEIFIEPVDGTDFRINNKAFRVSEVVKLLNDSGEVVNKVLIEVFEDDLPGLVFADKIAENFRKLGFATEIVVHARLISNSPSTSASLDMIEEAINDAGGRLRLFLIQNQIFAQGVKNGSSILVLIDNLNQVISSGVNIGIKNIEIVTTPDTSSQLIKDVNALIPTINDTVTVSIVEVLPSAIPFKLSIL